MAQVRVADLGVSLDGFRAGIEQSLDDASDRSERRCLKSNRRSFDSLRCASVAQDDSFGWIGFVLSPVPKCEGPGAPG